MIDHKGTPVIETDRLILRRFREDDAEDMFGNWANDSEVTRFLAWKPHGTVEATREILSRWLKDYENPQTCNWAIVPKETGKVAGSIAAVGRAEEHSRCEVGYCLGKAFWNRGIMTEALRAVVRYMIAEVGFNRVEALHHAGNPASGRVMMKAGMKYEGRLRQYHANNRGEYVDCEMYAILRGDPEG